ncbi:hypothetical protein TELCIR_01732 [Teladorsagia circumcincta]|uniref:Uncharacterized protein n=1 Tax=Teladorsagia circumcincta TaxID=45464 RepID=A0A2G9V134_TELCI|nr:hypothetical protein TELCIR_01732 [Teladorsagia circumcincta]
MISSRFSRYRPHFVAATILLGIGSLGYGTMKVGVMVKRWLMAPPRLLHEEMEGFLMNKDREARLKALKEQ